MTDQNNGYLFYNTKFPAHFYIGVVVFNADNKEISMYYICNKQ